MRTRNAGALQKRSALEAEREDRNMAENTQIPAPYQVSVEVGGRTLVLETGKIAKQANGAIVARYGDTVVLNTACMAPKPNDRDFLPLTVDYREYTYSAGKIPGGFFML